MFNWKILLRDQFNWLNVHEGDGDGQGGGGDPPPAKTFTQAEVDKIIADRLKKNTDQNKSLAEQLEKAKQQAGLTQQEKDALQEQIESLQKTYLTKEELSKQEQEKLTKKQKEETESLAKDRDTWKNQYSSLFIKGEITDAAVKNKAFNVEQMVDYLSPRTKLEPEIGDDGKPTGNLVPMTTIVAPDKDGKNQTLQLSIQDAVKKMREIPERFGNFFQAEGSGGTGTLNGSGSGGGSGEARFAKGAPYPRGATPEEHAKWRKNNLKPRAGSKT